MIKIERCVRALAVCVAMAMAPLAGLGVLLSDEKKGDEKKTESKKPETKPRLIPSGTITAQVIELDGDTLRLRLPQAGKPYRGRPEGKDGKDAADLELALSDDVKVRVPLKPEFDDKGRPKPPPKKDPKDPDRNLPGVKGSTSDLVRGAQVTINVAQTREKQPKTVATLILVSDEGRREKKDK